MRRGMGPEASLDLFGQWRVAARQDAGFVSTVNIRRKTG